MLSFGSVAGSFIVIVWQLRNSCHQAAYVFSAQCMLVSRQNVMIIISLSDTSWQSSQSYCGSWPCSTLRRRTGNLNFVHCRTGNQCSWQKTGVMCSCLRVLVITRSVTFSINCSRCCRLSAMSNSRLLQATGDECLVDCISLVFYHQSGSWSKHGNMPDGTMMTCGLLLTIKLTVKLTVF